MPGSVAVSIQFDAISTKSKRRIESDSLEQITKRQRPTTAGRKSCNLIIGYISVG